MNYEHYFTCLCSQLIHVFSTVMTLSLVVYIISLYKTVSTQFCDSSTCGDQTMLLNNGVRMPVVGLGTAGLTDQDTVTRAVDAAVKHGYRMIDTADLYDNHHQISMALNTSLTKHGLSREDVFLVTKIRPTDLGHLRCHHAVSRFLEELSTAYLDLVLIHAPVVPPILSMAPTPHRQRQLRIETWRCLEEVQRSGTVRSIGVSNYDVELLREVLENGEVVPQVNQVYMTPFHSQDDLKQFADDHKIQLQAYSSLGSHSQSRILKNKMINDISKKHSVSPAQVVLKWLVESGWSVIPKSTNPVHIKQNIDLAFELNKKDLLRIENL